MTTPSLSADTPVFPAPAKLNLFLHVTGVRPDGMHLLESVFILIDLCDELTIRVREDGEIRRGGTVIGEVEKDLCVRAAKALKEATGCTLGADIDVLKRIPAGAGMGGGSSDAATTLLALNRLWKTGLTVPQLAAIGVRLGADVPFFIEGHNGYVRGIGEIIEPVHIPETSWTVIMPGSSTSTAAVFKSPLLVKDTPEIGRSAFEKEFETLLPALPGRNDLEPVAEKINPDIAAARKILGPNSRMTGSGSAVFVSDEAAALPDTESTPKSSEAYENLPEGMTLYRVRTLLRHPMAD